MILPAGDENVHRRACLHLGMMHGSEDIVNELVIQFDKPVNGWLRLIPACGEQIVEARFRNEKVRRIVLAQPGEFTVALQTSELRILDQKVSVSGYKRIVVKVP